MYLPHDPVTITITPPLRLMPKAEEAGQEAPGEPAGPVES